MSNSLWLTTAYPREHFPHSIKMSAAMSVSSEVDLSGIANAYFLAKEGKDVILLEKDTILAGAPAIHREINCPT